MAYVALKPCRFAGQDFRIGDKIPGDLIHQGSAKDLVAMKKIAKMDGDEITTQEPEKNVFTIKIHAEEGDMPLELTEASLQSVFDVLTGKTTDVEEIINQMEDADALILLHITDSRKAVKTAAEARAKALGPQESEGEQ